MNRYIVVSIVCGGVLCSALVVLAWWDPARSGTMAEMLTAVAALITALTGAASKQPARPARRRPRRRRGRSRR